MHCGPSAPSRTGLLDVSDWKLEAKSLKKYPHFDAIITTQAAEELAKDPLRVQRHTFYPFMRYNQRWTKFSKGGAKGKVKKRPIRYASRADAYIFAYYRHVLSQQYEAELKSRNLSDSVLAYRRILGPNGRGKSNISHAYDAVNAIRAYKKCYVITFDISSFFESLDHIRLKSLWCRLLGTSRLPPDHFQVFKATTSYAVVDKLAVYERFGHFGVKHITPYGEQIKGYLTSHEDVPQQLCSGKEFRNKIAGGNGQPSLIKKNLKPYGIPQGAPISDILANLYLLDFDDAALGMITNLGGKCMRYSDDILIIVPCDEKTAYDIEATIRQMIRGFGQKLKIKEEKSSIFKFEASSQGQTCERIHGDAGRNGLEYLGFRYDGRSVYLRDSTLSNLRRKMSRVARAAAISHAIRYPDRDSAALKASFNHDGLACRFRKVEDFHEKKDDPRNWTFWTYARRASDTFKDLGRPILGQLRNHRRLLRDWVNEEIDRAAKRRPARP